MWGSRAFTKMQTLRLRLGLLALGFAAADAKPLQAELIAPSWVAKAPSTCGACVAADHVWCYHDDTCYVHGDPRDLEKAACPGKDRCAARGLLGFDCTCSTCDEAACKMPVPNAESCSAALCEVEHQFCPPNRPGSNGSGFCCVGGTWSPGLCPDAAPLAAVEQVHIAYGIDHTKINVAWTSNAATALQVLYGPTDAPLRFSAVSDSRPLNIAETPGPRFTHVATLENMENGKAYSYTIGNRQFGFDYHRNHTTGRPDVHIIFGDLGVTHGFSLCEACVANSAVCDKAACELAEGKLGLVSEVAGADMMMQVGDFAYNLVTENGYYGDQFMRNIEQIAAEVPFMVTQGNHEDTPGNLAHYVERFRNMPANSEDAPTFTTEAGPGAANSLYFSWDAGLVHYITLSTEMWFGTRSTDGKVNTTTMLKWLENDLIAANKNRANVPWVIAQGHRNIWCSTSDDADCGAAQAGLLQRDLEPLWFKYGLDIWINGHEHSYERTYPMYQGKSERCSGECTQGSKGAQDPTQNCSETCTDPNATIYLITGAAGSREMHEGFDNAQPSWSAFRSNTFGYSRLIVHNHTHIRWQEVQTDPTLFPTAKYGSVIDDMWVIQNSHGPFAKDRAPKGTAWPVGDETPGRSFDHFGPLLGLDDGTGRSTSALIREFKRTHGETAWAEKEDGLLRLINSKIGGETVWEDVRGEGSSAGSWFKWKEQTDEDVARVMRR